MNQQVTIIDYGMGNMLNVVRAFEHIGADVSVAVTPNDIKNANRLVLPGVGAFGEGMIELRQRCFVEPVQEFAQTGKPLLGICLGMQMMLSYSNEFGRHDGLELIPGNVDIIPAHTTDGMVNKVPHIGWNALHPCAAPWTSTILSNTSFGQSVYFVHSFMAIPTYPAHRLANCHYGGHEICAVAQSDNLFGCQFHPEKSGTTGLEMLKQFMIF